MNLLEEMTLTEHDVVYRGTNMSELTATGKPKRSLMREWTVGQRIEKFFEFCLAYDLREDSLLATNYQQFSHRLHWHECPFVDDVASIKHLRTLIWACINFSFTNEKWDTYLAWREDRLDEFLLNGNPASRHDLFQIYFPKGTKVIQWIREVPYMVSLSFEREVERKCKPYTMMQFAEALNDHFVEHHGFRSALYACKNVARHVAMSHPELVDPDSFLHGGTGFFDGLLQVFDEDMKSDEDRMKVAMNVLRDHPLNPITKHVYLNLEDKLCFFYKHIAMRHGLKKQRSQIPYEWIYPSDWSLKTGRYS